MWAKLIFDPRAVHGCRRHDLWVTDIVMNFCMGARAKLFKIIIFANVHPLIHNVSSSCSFFSNKALKSHVDLHQTFDFFNIDYEMLSCSFSSEDVHLEVSKTLEDIFRDATHSEPVRIEEDIVNDFQHGC